MANKCDICNLHFKKRYDLYLHIYATHNPYFKGKIKGYKDETT